MADERLRQRRRLGVVPTAKAALLRERVRSGELAEERLLLAAQLGDPASEAAIGSTTPPSDDVVEWIASMQELGGLALMRRAALAALKPCFDRWGSLNDLEEAKELWEAGRVFTLCPCVEHLPEPPWTGLGGATSRERGWCQLGWLYWPHACAHVLNWAQRYFFMAKRLRAHLRGKLVPWVLSEYDPLVMDGKTLAARFPGEDSPDLLNHMAVEAEQFELLEAGVTLQSFLSRDWRAWRRSQDAKPTDFDFNF